MKNLSIFDKIVEFEAPDGNHYAAESCGSGIYDIRQMIDGSWIQICKTAIGGKCTPKKVWDEIGELKDADFVQQILM